MIQQLRICMAADNEMIRELPTRKRTSLAVTFLKLMKLCSPLIPPGRWQPLPAVLLLITVVRRVFPPDDGSGCNLSSLLVSYSCRNFASHEEEEDEGHQGMYTAEAVCNVCSASCQHKADDNKPESTNRRGPLLSLSALIHEDEGALLVWHCVSSFHQLRPLSR
jgi:hypothetical protein